MTDLTTELVRTRTELSSEGSDEDDRSELGPYVVAGPFRFGSDRTPVLSLIQKRLHIDRRGVRRVGTRLSDGAAWPLGFIHEVQDDKQEGCNS